MCARVMPTMSSLPAAIACRAVAASVMRAAWNTGRPVAAHLAREVEVRGRGHPHDRDHVEKSVVAVDVAADDVDEVDEAGGGQAAADLEALLALEADLPALVAGHADADQEPVADRRAHRLEHAQAERIRFSRLPPHSSSRRLVAGDQNWSGRWP